MQIFLPKLSRSSNELPSRADVEKGDLAMLSAGDVFCFMGDQWKLLGGRWVSPRIKQAFFDYVKGGWPDYSSMAYDLEAWFELSDLFSPDPGFGLDYDQKDIRANPTWEAKFKEAILETCKQLQPPSDSYQL